MSHQIKRIKTQNDFVFSNHDNILKNSSLIQDSFLSKLANYINGACFSRFDFLNSLFFPIIPSIKNAKTIFQEYHQKRAKVTQDSHEELNLIIEPYERKNIHVYKMIQYLDKYLRDDLYGAYVHGSLGTYEEIAYSDFDALVVLKHEVFDTPKRLRRVARKLSKARSFMYDFDPLQHHGWFVLTEAHLKFYPEYYFPVELFYYAKSLFMNKGLKLKIIIRDSSEKGQKTYNELSNSIIRRLQNKNYPKNIYQLKLLLSQFMLLPALYVQLRDGEGIYKKYSFDAAKVDFSDNEWSIMDEVALLRGVWKYEMSSYRRWLITRSNHISRYLAKKFSPFPPKHMKRVLTDNFFQRMQCLTISMQRRIS